MSHIRITKRHHLTHRKAKEAAEAVARDLHKRFGLAYEWDGDCVEFSRTGLAGKLHVLTDQVRLDCKLGLVMSVFKPALEGAVHEEFDRYFGKPKD
jgi:putative polyhydroxyalkanoate system protein